MTPVNINNMIVQWSGLWPTHSLRWNGSNQIIDRQWVVSIWKRYFYQNQFYLEMGIKYWFSNSDSIKPGKNLYWKNQLWLGFEIEAGSEMHQEVPSTLPCSLNVARRGNEVFFCPSFHFQWEIWYKIRWFIIAIIISSICLALWLIILLSPWSRIETSVWTEPSRWQQLMLW